jgi:hypothetical protein
MENLSAQFNLDHPKIPMIAPGWESFKLWLSYERTRSVVERVTGDVTQHRELYRRLQSIGYLGRPKPWTLGRT